MKATLWATSAKSDASTTKHMYEYNKSHMTNFLPRKCCFQLQSNMFKHLVPSLQPDLGNSQQHWHPHIHAKHTQIVLMVLLVFNYKLRSLPHGDTEICSVQKLSLWEVKLWRLIHLKTPAILSFWRGSQGYKELEGRWWRNASKKSGIHVMKGSV